MQDVLESILAIDILSSPRDYAAEVLRVICSHFGYHSGIAQDRTQGEPTIFSAYQLSLPDSERLASVTCELFGEAGISPLADEIHFLSYTEDEWMPGSGEVFGHLPRVRNIVKVPIRYHGQVLGNFYLYHTDDHQVELDERVVLSHISEMVSVAMVSNQYLGQLDQRTRELQQEVAERKRIEAALRDALRERRELEEIVNRSPLIVFRCRATGDWPIDFVSSTVSQLGYAPEDFYGGAQTFLEIIYSPDRKRVSAEMERALADSQQELALEFRVMTRDSDVRWVETRFCLRRDYDVPDLLHVLVPPSGQITHFQGIMQDITERKRAEDTIRHQAYHDTLTDLPNRTLFQDRLTHALARARRHNSMLAVMFLDLDRFKTINDTFGHAVGDRLLRGISERLKKKLRGEDTISRLGGDEFTILLPEVRSADDAASVAEKILQALKRPFHFDGHELHISTSLGISLYPSDGEDAQTLLQNADTALYASKEQGRNNFQFYTSTMSDKALERLALENELRRAITENQFELYYQPQVDLDTSQVTGMEALLRWHHPTLGTISPSRFIPVAEETGLIVPLGQWVLREACRQNKAWQDDGHTPLRVAVNLSARQFHQHNLTDVVASVLADTGLAPECLELEITESVAMRDIDFSITVMRNLRRMGVQLSIDDFGVGHSSLIYLKKFPINTLKIDQSFVRGLTTDPNDQAIATAIITMARSLRLRVIAEGVEHEEQLHFLRESRCDGMQGYLFSEPLPPNAFTQFLRFLVI